MSKNIVSNPFASALKADLEKRLAVFHGAFAVEVNPRSAWVKGEVPTEVQTLLKDAGFLVCRKGYYFTHDCVKMPEFKAEAREEVKTVVKAEKPAREYAELDAAVKTRVMTAFRNMYPGCQIEIRGTWVFVSGEKTRDYKDALKESGLHWGFKVKAWSGPIPESMLTEQTKQGEEKFSPKEDAPKFGTMPVPEVARTDAQNEELVELSKIIIQARKGLLTHDEMIARMKEACPF